MVWLKGYCENIYLNVLGFCNTNPNRDKMNFFFTKCLTFIAVSMFVWKLWWCSIAESCFLCRKIFNIDKNPTNQNDHIDPWKQTNQILNFMSTRIRFEFSKLTIINILHENIKKITNLFHILWPILNHLCNFRHLWIYSLHHLRSISKLVSEISI